MINNLVIQYSISQNVDFFKWLEEIWGNIKETPRGDSLFDARQWITKCCNVIVDGRFEVDKKDPSLEFRGSANQRIIDAFYSDQFQIVPYDDSNYMVD